MTEQPKPDVKASNTNNVRKNPREDVKIIIKVIFVLITIIGILIAIPIIIDPPDNSINIHPIFIILIMILTIQGACGLPIYLNLHYWRFGIREEIENRKAELMKEIQKYKENLNKDELGGRTNQ